MTLKGKELLHQVFYITKSQQHLIGSIANCSLFLSLPLFFSSSFLLFLSLPLSSTIFNIVPINDCFYGSANHCLDQVSAEFEQGIIKYDKCSKNNVFEGNLTLVGTIYSQISLAYNFLYQLEREIQNTKRGNIKIYRYRCKIIYVIT